MSQATPNAPSVVVNAAGNRQQVSLRDYLNGRVAPFLKKAVTESLGVEAEFPLQWLGECLIHQSILYEGNPDRTNIRERFLYTFEDPKPQEPTESAPVPAESAPETVSHQTEAASAPQQDNVQGTPEVPMNESAEQSQTIADPSSIEPASAQPLASSETQLPQTTPATATDVTSQAIPAPEVPVTNGVKDEGEASESRAGDEDTEMGGIS